MPLIGSIVFNVFFYLSLIPITAIILSLYFFISTKNLQKVGSIWIRVVLNALKIFCGIRWKVEGVENIPNTPCIVVSNHQGQWESFFFTNIIYSLYKHYKKRITLYTFVWMGFKVHGTHNLK